MFVDLNLLYRLSALYGFIVVEQRERVQRFNSVLSIYVYSEDNAKHSRPHAHITLNNRKIGEIYIDNWEIIDRDNKLNRKTLEEVNKWTLSHKKELTEEWNRCNKRIQIEFLSY